MMTRRKLLKLSAKLGAAATAASLAPRSLWASPMGLPIGIQLYAVKGALQKDPAGTLKRLYAIGYREVETAGYAGMTAAAFSKLIHDAKLHCPSAHVQFGKTDFSKAFADAHALGAQYAVSSALAFTIIPFPAPVHGKPPQIPSLTEDDFKRMADLMNRIGKAARAAGLTYAYHNHNLEFVRMPDGSYGYDLLLKQTDPDTVKFEVDCGWMVAAGASPVHYFESYPGRYRMMHVKDFATMAHPTTVLIGPGHPEGRELGHGFIKYGPIFKAAKAAGVQHAFAEQEAPFAHSELESAKIDYDYLASFS